MDREASPTAAIIDRQGVKSTESRGPCGYDVGKKVKGPKRHTRDDTVSGIQDRHGAGVGTCGALVRSPSLLSSSLKVPTLERRSQTPLASLSMIASGRLRRRRWVRLDRT